ncbi:SsgA family sporulation/cell division regulator [Streptomyces sp. NPDC090088]|uniref:SsgA family sporulation/cell division regulator n=1 Tax=Streptomyces sp. NPDC090088 TaxID=3365944 RepID=UPI003812972F
MSSCIDRTLYVELALTADHRVKVLTRLSYRPHDPYAVHLIFYTDIKAPVTWVIARDLLAEGMLGPSGEGDVRVWPTRTGPDAVLNLVLSSPHGVARLAAPFPAVMQWLERTYLVVPSGQEMEGIDLDTELSQLLHGTA